MKGSGRVRPNIPIPPPLVSEPPPQTCIPFNEPPPRQREKIMASKPPQETLAYFEDFFAVHIASIPLYLPHFFRTKSGGIWAEGGGMVFEKFLTTSNVFKSLLGMKLLVFFVCPRCSEFLMFFLLPLQNEKSPESRVRNVWTPPAPPQHSGPPLADGGHGPGAGVIKDGDSGAPRLPAGLLELHPHVPEPSVPQGPPRRRVSISYGMSYMCFWEMTSVLFGSNAGGRVVGGRRAPEANQDGLRGVHLLW